MKIERPAVPAMSLKTIKQTHRFAVAINTPGPFVGDPAQTGLCTADKVRLHGQDGDELLSLIFRIIKIVKNNTGF